MTSAVDVKVKPRWTRRVLRSGLVIAAITTAVVGWAIFRRPTQGAMFYYQYRCLHYQAPEAEVVYRAPAQLQWIFASPITAMPEDNDEKPDANGAGGTTDDNCVVLPPHLILPGAVGDPAPPAQLNAYMNYPLPDNMQVLFCHELHTAGGPSRLVIVCVGPLINTAQSAYAFEMLVVQPVNLGGLIRGESPRILSRQRKPLEDSRLLAIPAIFHAGQTDPADSSAFNLAYYCDDKPAILHGRLLPDSGHVELYAEVGH